MSRQDGTGRERLIGLASLAALLAAAAGGLVVLQLEARRGAARGEPAPDAVAIAYLRALVDRHPHDREARLRLARAELALGLTGDAEHALAPLLEADPPETSEVPRLALDVAVAAWRAARDGTPERAAARTALHRRLERLCERSEAPSELVSLAALARGLGQLGLAARAAERAAALDPARCSELLSRAARDLLASGAPGRAAATSERAYGCAEGPGESLGSGLETLDAYLAADMGAEALRFAGALATRFASEREVLARAEEIALAQSDLGGARRFGARLVELGAAQPARLRRQLDLALAAGDLDGAVLAAGRLLADSPLDPLSRLTAARVASWAGQHALALRHLTWLARRGAPGTAEQALALARALRDDATVAEVLALEARTRPLPPPALEELANALERLGEPERAAAALEDHAARHPASRDAWQALAALHERRSDLSSALAVRGRIARRFGPSLDGSMAVARLHRARGDPGAALAELRRWVTSADPSRAEYWELLGELAWSAGAREVASRAYHTLREAGRIDALGAERLFLLGREAGRTDDAIRHGREGWQRTGEPRLLLLAMDEAARAGRWSVLAGLAGEAEGAAPAFARSPTYWMLRARLDEKAGRPAQAADRYRRALELDPTSAAARSGLLWLFVASGDRAALSRQLAAWRSDADRDPGLWRAYAGGLEALGRRREALTFLERVARADPDDAAAVALVESLRTRGERATRVVAEAGAETFGPLRLQRMGTSALSELLGGEVELRAGLTRLTSREVALPRSAEGAELALRASHPLLGGRTELSAALGLRGGDALAGGALAHARAVGGPFEARLDGAFNEPAAESAALLAEGVRHRLGGTLAASTGAVYGRLAAGWRRWAVRGGGWLATGGSGAVELGLRARGADPEIRVRVLGEHQRNDLAAHLPPGITSITQGGPILPKELSTVGGGAAISRWRLGPTHLSADAWLGWMTPPLRPAYRLQATLSVAATRGTELSVAGFAGNDRWDLGRGGLGMTVSLAHHFHR